MRLAGAVAALVALLLSAVPAAAQRTVVVPQRQGTAVGLALALDAGGIWDREAEAGAGRLAGEAVLEALRPELDALGAVARVECDRVALRFTLLAPPATWRIAAQMLLDAVFHPTIEEAALEAARSTLLRALRIEEGSPVEEIRVLTHEALFGKGHRWARPRCGSPETVEELDAETVQRAARLRFDPDRATAAIVGPVDEADARALLTGALGDQALSLILPAPTPPPLPTTRLVDDPTVTAFVGMAFPLPPNPDDEATRLLAALLADGLGPGAARPEVSDATAVVERWGGGGALVVYGVVAPDHAQDWANAVRSRVGELAAEPEGEARFDAALRRYRGLRLVAMAAPETRAADAAERLFFDHDRTSSAERIDGLTAARLEQAAATLGEPAVAVLGPAPEPSQLDRRK